MEPEEDFETWLVILNTVMDDMPSFGSVLPSLKRCLLTIKETENLPPPLEENTARFEKMLYPEVVSKLLALGNLDNDDLKIIYDAFEAVIEYCVYGIKAKKSNAVTCISHILLDKESKVYKSNNKEEIRQNMAQMFIVKDGFDASIDALKGTNYDDKSMSLLREIVMNCSEYVHGFDKVSFMKEMCKSMTECAVRNIRILSSNEVMSFFKMFIESDATGITDWLNLFTILLQSNVFDKQLLALKSILSILRKEKNQEEILGWMTDNLDTISSVELHSEFMESIGEIYSYCTNKGLLSMEAITNLWNQQKYIFATELEKFYKIFSQIAQKIPVDLCP